jgi:hypothetical protein
LTKKKEEDQFGEQKPRSIDTLERFLREFISVHQQKEDVFDFGLRRPREREREERENGQKQVNVLQQVRLSLNVDREDSDGTWAYDDDSLQWTRPEVSDVWTKLTESTSTKGLCGLLDWKAEKYKTKHPSRAFWVRGQGVGPLVWSIPIKVNKNGEIKH